MKNIDKKLNKFIQLINNYDEKGDVEYPKVLHNLHNHLPFLPEKKKINKCNKLLCNL